MKLITVIGSGNLGFATAAHLSYKGFEVCFCGSKPSKTINIKGCIDTTVEVYKTSTNKQEAVKSARYIILTVVSLYQAEVIKEIAKHIPNDSIIILFPGKFGGSLYIENLIKKINPDFNGYVVESTPVYAARLQDKNTVRISGVKNTVRFSSTTLEKTNNITNEIQMLYPMLIPSESWLQRSLCEIGSIMHVPTFLFNINRIEQKESFLFYAEGVTPKIAEIITALDQERTKFAEVLGVNCYPLVDIIKEYYDTEGNNVYEIIHNTIPYQSIKGPDSLNHRYIYEEISEYYIPLYELSVSLKLDFPMLKLIIDLSILVTKYDFYKNGRSLNKIVKDVNAFHENTQKQLFIH